MTPKLWSAAAALVALLGVTIVWMAVYAAPAQSGGEPDWTATALLVVAVTIFLALALLERGGFRRHG